MHKKKETSFFKTIMESIINNRNLLGEIFVLINMNFQNGNVIFPYRKAACHHVYFDTP